MEMLYQLQDKTKLINDSELTTFIYVLNQVIDHQYLTKSNKKIAEERKKSVSTIEKHLNKLDKIGLISRSNLRRFNNIILQWETESREITIPTEVINPKILAEMRAQRIHNVLAMIVTPEATSRAIKQMRESRS
ncbi:MAG: hypothetical protein JEZ05_06330 [Tenericutes bacterium]|nr:hypothetical protein [Mycoplasmatota bacterium]